MRLGIIANTAKPEISESVAEFVERNIARKDFQFIFSKLTYDFLSKQLKSKKLKVKYFSEKNFKGKLDYLISFGGDGTMLYSTAVAIKADVPLIGVNFGKLGFLADISYDELEDTLEEIITNNFLIEERILLEGVFLSIKKEKFTALNDIVIDKGGWSRIIEIDTWVNQKYLTTYRSDGLIISTPTGSTGYSLSTGGPILLPDSNVIVLSPICPHTLTVRPIVIPSESEIIIEAKSAYESVMINRDGQQVFKIKPPVKIKIKKADRTLKLVKRNTSDYFETLREKLMWGMDVRTKTQD